MSLPTLAIGLMSGTSADGVSAVLAFFEEKKFKIVEHFHHDYAAGIVEKVRRGPFLTAAELSQLNFQIGEEFAHAANKLLKKAGADPAHVSCIGSHGQTIYHGPRDQTPNTLQIGEPAVIAERTRITVVSNFRTRDVAAGGEGAPLIPFFDRYFWGDGPVRAFQNIGGIANVAVVGKGVKEPLAFDTGPGNGLMDRAMYLATNGREGMDKNGQRAKHGTMDTEAINRMLQSEFFRRPPPKSTGPEYFGDAFLNEHLGSKLTSHLDDVLATLNYFTCVTIQEAYRNFVFPKYSVSEIVISGGGTHNKTLMKKLECLFAPIPVKTIESFGIPTQIKEPLAFAFFGYRCVIGRSNHLPAATGAKHARVLGSITRAGAAW